MNKSHSLNQTVVVTSMDEHAIGATESVGTLSSHQFQSNHEAVSTSEGTKKLLKVTTGIRLANRSTGNWHHCGLND
ncbi:hypothetical protein [Prosthecobacter sp.]|uniref:hypothetical protein n=1 Tax=Prosthecobacter sp. TaxID=1965333 RepID=UPI001D64835B|nr:hypothetical protein [Prosthecobacter sp.]MCB1276533.1 hypothetical protein [Prosthecobacter sp.]